MVSRQATDLRSGLGAFLFEGLSLFDKLFFVNQAVSRALDPQGLLRVMARLHLFEDWHIFVSVQAEDKSFSSGSTCSSCAMEVVRCSLWEIEVDYVAYEWKIKAARCQISRDQHVGFPFLEPQVIHKSKLWRYLAMQRA